MTKLLVILVVLGFCGLMSADSGSQIDNDLYQIEHAIGDSQEFTPIGQVNLRHLKQTQNAAHYQMLDSADESKQSNIPKQIPVELLSTELETFRLEPVHIDQIESSLRANEHSIYQLRLCKKTLPSQPQKCLASTFTHLKFDSSFFNYFTVVKIISNTRITFRNIFEIVNYMIFDIFVKFKRRLLRKKK
jgi:hypothetical protein